MDEDRIENRVALSAGDPLSWRLGIIGRLGSLLILDVEAASSYDCCDRRAVIAFTQGDPQFAKSL